MKFNGATFNKAQQDQLKKKIGAELEDLIKKVDDMKLNKYTYSFSSYTYERCALLYRICDAAKGKILLRIANQPCYISKQYDGNLIIVSIAMGVSPSSELGITKLEITRDGAVSGFMAITQSNSFGVTSVGSDKLKLVEITYYNDTEIL